MEKQRRLAQSGFLLACVGLAIAAVSVLPGVLSIGSFPWPLIVGTAIYLPGAFMVMIGSRGPGMKEAIGRLRFVRLGFIAVFAFAVFRLFNP